MNKKLTIKERVGLPETNSSSSHAIVINDLNDKEYLSELLEYINSDNILELPRPLSPPLNQTKTASLYFQHSVQSKEMRFYFSV